MARPDERSSQIEKFREAARELETDNSEANFDQTLQRVAAALAKPESKKSSTK